MTRDLTRISVFSNRLGFNLPIAAGADGNALREKDSVGKVTSFQTVVLDGVGRTRIGCGGHARVTCRGMCVFSSDVEAVKVGEEAVLDGGLREKTEAVN